MKVQGGNAPRSGSCDPRKRVFTKRGTSDNKKTRRRNNSFWRREPYDIISGHCDKDKQMQPLFAANKLKVLRELTGLDVRVVLRSRNE